jgi:arylsulfatase A-like enzyme
VMAVGLIAAMLGCAGPPPAARHPSIFLFVFDTTRADAVSAYGHVADTTPTADGLAAGGLLYTHAYAQAPWTLPSHATLFTGLTPAQHGVGWRHTRAPDSWVTLAELLAGGGYETVGVSENLWVSEQFNMTQGFEHFTAFDFQTLRTPEIPKVVAEWARTRDRGRPFFLFVNVIDADRYLQARSTNAPFQVTERVRRRSARVPGPAS